VQFSGNFPIAKIYYPAFGPSLGGPIFWEGINMKMLAACFAVIVIFAGSAVQAADVTIKVRAIDGKGVGKQIGTLRAVDTKKGLRIVPRLSGLTPGEHGFHVHQNPRCGTRGAGGKRGAGLAAGGHFDPKKAGQHMGPGGSGHLGDLPKLMVDAKGNARKSVLAPRLKVADLWGRAIVIHAGGDNYSDNPKSLGGGGARVACATIVRAKSRGKAKKK
jgi:Cu-Zn family superoxide dismutase